MPIHLKPNSTEAAPKAYAPYSRLKACAAVLSKNGAIYADYLIDNASLQDCLCTQRAAIITAVPAEKKL